MRLYHGSNMEIVQIDLTKSNKFKDFGQAFYLSADKHQAKLLAESRADFLGGEPMVNPFEYDEHLAKTMSLKIKVFEYYCLEWASFVWNNRDEQQDFHHDYDIVYGPIMNDTIGFQMREYRMHHTDLKGFLEGIKFEKGETFQWAFCTQRAISCLKRLK